MRGAPETKSLEAFPCEMAVQGLEAGTFTGKGHYSSLFSKLSTDPWPIL